MTLLPPHAAAVGPSLFISDYTSDLLSLYVNNHDDYNLPHKPLRAISLR